MYKYLIGFLINFFNFRISKFAMIDSVSDVGCSTLIYRGCRILNSKINSFTYIAPNSSIVHATVGKFCSISQNVFVGLPDHKIKALSTSPLFQTKKNALKISWVKSDSDFEEHAKVTIGNDVWIGMNVLIKGGITIGDGVIIGAGAIVTKDIPPYAIVVGAPAKIIKFRFEKEIIDKLLLIRWWDLPKSELLKNISLFSDFNSCNYDLDKLLKKNENLNNNSSLQ